MFVLLIGLGMWQLQRLHWKLGLIAEMTHNMAAAPISLDAALALGADAQYRPVTLTGQFENSREVYVFTTGPQGVPVYHVLTPLALTDGRVMMVDRGFVPTTLRNPSSRPGSEPQGHVVITAIWRMPDVPGPFTPRPDMKHRVWFARDIAGIARAENLKLAAPAILEATAATNKQPWPKGGQTRVDLPNDHLQYALTWFMLAAVLVVIYFVFHHAHGRLEIAAGRKSHRAGG
jgi:surfeit locus 1 family protein